MFTAASNRSKSLAFLSCPRDSVWFLRHNEKGFGTAELFFLVKQEGVIWALMVLVSFSAVKDANAEFL